MSTKIYQGFRLETTDLRKILDIINVFRPKLMYLAEELFCSSIRNVMVDGKTVSEAIGYWWDRKRRLEEISRNDTVTNPYFSLTFIPSKRYTLGIVYTAQWEWFKLWCETDGVREYGYWNNVDRPEEVSSAEWRKRSKHWDILGYDPVCTQGFSIELLSTANPREIYGFNDPTKENKSKAIEARVLNASGKENIKV